MEHDGVRSNDQRRPKFDCLLFDLDDTLYPASSGIGADTMKNIQDYMVQRLGVEERMSLQLSILLYRQYGSNIAGLRALGYRFDYDEYHRFIRGRLAYEKIKPDLVLRDILLSLPIRKVVFTNADRTHASRALERLGIEDCFESVVGFETMNPPSSPPALANESEIFDIAKHLAHPEPGFELPESSIMCKPSPETMLHALKIASFSPQTTVFFDDSATNISSAKQIGMHTVLVGSSERTKGADHALESLHSMKEALPALWEEAEKGDDVCNTSKG